MPVPKSTAHYVRVAYVVAEYAAGKRRAAIARELGVARGHVDAILTRMRDHSVDMLTGTCVRLPLAPSAQLLAVIRKHTRDAPSLYGLPEPQPDTPEYFFMRERGPIYLHGALLHPQPEG